MGTVGASDAKAGTFGVRSICWLQASGKDQNDDGDQDFEKPGCINHAQYQSTVTTEGKHQPQGAISHALTQGEKSDRQ